MLGRRRVPGSDTACIGLLQHGPRRYKESSNPNADPNPNPTHPSTALLPATVAIVSRCGIEPQVGVVRSMAVKDGLLFSFFFVGEQKHVVAYLWG